MKIKVVCCVCRIIIQQGPDNNVSHGYCRRCELETYATENMLTMVEYSELKMLREMSRSST